MGRPGGGGSDEGVTVVVAIVVDAATGRRIDFEVVDPGVGRRWIPVVGVLVAHHQLNHPGIHGVRADVTQVDPLDTVHAYRHSERRAGKRAVADHFELYVHGAGVVEPIDILCQYDPVYGIETGPEGVVAIEGRYIRAARAAGVPASPDELVTDSVIRAAEETDSP